MNGSALIAAVRTATLVPTTQVSDDALLGWLNEGYYRIASLYPWPWLEASVASLTTAIGQPSHTLASIASTPPHRIVAVYDSAHRYPLRSYDLPAALEVFGDDPFTQLASTITEPIVSTSATSMTLADASLFSDLAGHVPTADAPIWLRFTADGEIVKCTNFTGEVATIERGQEGTTAATHLDNAAVAFVAAEHMAHPTGFLIWGASLYLLPVPDAVIPLRIVYHADPAALTAGTSPAFDTMFHHCLAHYGEFRMWQREEDLDKATAAYSHYLDTVARMWSWYSRRTDWAPWAVGKPDQGSVFTNTPFLDGL